MLLLKSGTHNFAYESLMLLQLPIHAHILKLKGLNEGSLLLIFIVSGLTLHS